MPVLEFEYTGDNVIISKHIVEEHLGLRPGDRVVIRSKVELIPRQRSLHEIQQIREILKPTIGSWTSEDAETFYKQNDEQWASWQVPESV